MLNNSTHSSLSANSDSDYSTKLRIYLNSCYLHVKVSRPYVIITMGDQIFQTSISEFPDGKWNEGYELTVSYHAQLFDTIQFDVYDSYMLLPDRHIGRAELRLVELENMPDTFTGFYKIWDKELSSGASSFAVRKSTTTRNVGALQIKIIYQFQTIPTSSFDTKLQHRGRSPNDLLDSDSEEATSTPGVIERESTETRKFRQRIQQYRDASIIRFRKYDVADYYLNTSMDDDDDDGSDQQQHLTEKSSNIQTESSSYQELFLDDRGSESINNQTRQISVDTTKRSSKPHDDVPLAQRSNQPCHEKIPWMDSFNTLFASLNPLRPTPSITTTTSTITNKNDTALHKVDILNDMDDSLETFPILDTLSSWVISKETNQVLRAIRKLLATFGQGFELSNLQVLIGFVVVEKFYQELGRERTWDLVTDLSEIRLASHLWQFSMASYGWKGLNFIGQGNGYFSDAARNQANAKSLMEHLSLSEQDLLAYEFRSGQAFRPSYFVAHDRSTNAVVLSIRGTMSAFDTMTDLVCDYEPWKGGMVHKGMKASAMWFFHHLVPKVIAYVNSQSTSALYIVGHSLGAATAAILTIMLLDYMDELKKGKSDDFILQCFGYAPACGLSLDLSEKYKDHLQSVVFADDAVSKLCYGTMMDLKQIIITGYGAARHVGISELLWTDDEPGKQKWKEVFKQVAECRKRCIEAQENPRLYVAGMVYQFWLDPTPENETRIVVERTTAKRVSSELILKKSILVDHLPTNFDIAFRRAMTGAEQNQDGVLNKPVQEHESTADKAKTKLAEHELKHTSKRGGGKSQMVDEQYIR